MGKTISITIPDPLEKELKEASVLQGVSRSRFICNILLRWHERVEEIYQESNRNTGPCEDNKGKND